MRTSNWTDRKTAKLFGTTPREERRKRRARDRHDDDLANAIFALGMLNPTNMSVEEIARAKPHIPIESLREADALRKEQEARERKQHETLPLPIGDEVSASEWAVAADRYERALDCLTDSMNHLSASLDMALDTAGTQLVWDPAELAIQDSPPTYSPETQAAATLVTRTIGEAWQAAVQATDQILPQSRVCSAAALTYAAELEGLLSHYLKGEPEASLREDFRRTLAIAQEASRVFAEHGNHLREWKEWEG